MKRRYWLLGAVCLVLMVAAGSGLCARTGKDGGEGDFEMYVAPNVIVKSAPCLWVTIHTEVSESAVDGVSVTVDGSEITDLHTYADSRGNLVVKLKFDDVIACTSPPDATFVLTLLVDGEILEATATAQVND